MNPFDAIEKLITEHGSAAILTQQLNFAKDKYAALEKEVAKLEAKIEIEHSNHVETKQELQRLKDEHAEEIRVHSMVEFRRGKRTGGKWLAFCPKCHLPAHDSAAEDRFDGRVCACCTAQCGWEIYPNKMLSQMIAEISS